MPRNKSEKLPKVLLTKKVTPAMWGDPGTVKIVELPESAYRVEIHDADYLRFTRASRYADALDIFDRMFDGFYFSSTPTLTGWEREYGT